MQRFTLITIALLALLSGCQSRPPSSAADPLAPARNPEAARRHVLEGIAALERQDLTAAEAAFNQALRADAFSGTAYNNLGKVYFLQGQFYQAAWQFQHAARLLPHHPEPRNNLGLVLEEAGRMDEAVAQYEAALHSEPDNPVLLGNLIRARLRRGDQGSAMRTLLSDYLLKETRPDWRRWAQRQATLHPDDRVSH